MSNMTRQTAAIYWQETKKYPRLTAWLLIGLIGATATNLYRPIIAKQFFDAFASPDVTSHILFGFVWLFLGASLVNEIFWRVTVYASIAMTGRILANIANRCYNYLQGHSYNFFNNSFVGSLVSRTNRFIWSYEKIYDQLVWSLGPTAFNITVILVVLGTRLWVLAAIILIWALIYLIVNYLFIRYKMQFDRASADAESKITAHLADTISNQINLKLFSARGREEKEFDRLTDGWRVVSEKTWRLDAHLQTFQATFMVVLEFILLYVAVTYWERGLLTIGDFALIQGYLMQIFRDLWGVGKYIRRIYEAFADAEEMTKILSTAHEVVDAAEAKPLMVVNGKLEIQNLAFAYHKNRSIYKGFNLSVEGGQRIAFIGPSGGGKSTIVKLLLRFFDIQRGEILIDGQNIAEVTQDSLRDNIALVPQDPILFHRTLMENIRYARPEATDQEVYEAAKRAHCHEFITKFPEKYQTLVGERGVKLSGGERQRVAIARAILKNAPILILDEATSSLDSESESYIQAALKELMQGRTTIVIAHRLSTIMQMDRIVVIEEGAIREQGTHRELLKVKDGAYQKLWEIQAGGFAQQEK